MKKIVSVLCILFLISCGDSNEDHVYKEWTTDRSVQESEKQNPINYITIEKTEQESNFWGTKSEFKVYIKNTAKYTVYKDLVLRIQWLSKTGTIIEEKKYTRFDFFQPNHKYEIGFELPAMPEEAKKYLIIVEDVKFSEEI